MAENDLGIWFRSIPIVTRWWFSLSIIFPLLGRLGLVNGMYMILDYYSITRRFQVSFKCSNASVAASSCIGRLIDRSLLHFQKDFSSVKLKLTFQLLLEVSFVCS